nr:60S ribosomal protein L18A [Cryptomonas curvata]
MSWLKEYCVIGRSIPNENTPEPELFAMKIFAQNEIKAKSRFWYFVKKTQKKKKTLGELVTVKRIFEKKNKNIKNYGIWIRFESKSGTTNMYKEYRDVLMSSAIEQMYIEMSGKHKAKWSSIIILRIEELRNKECIRNSTKQFHSYDIKFPIIRNICKSELRGINSNFKSKKPCLTIKN